MSKLNVLVCGSTGYIGIELVKILVKHKKIHIKYLCGNSSVGKNISFYDKSLSKKKLPIIRKFQRKLLKEVDVIFSALPNGEAQKLSKFLLDKNLLIDLSADFRLKNKNEYLKWYKIRHSAQKLIQNSIYSLPELKKKQLKNQKIISSPGCYPTSILLPLGPLIQKNLISNKNIVINSMSGYSGAGRNVHKKYKNKNLYESISAYGIANHRHNSEIQQELDLYTKKKNYFDFTPHLSPMFRGIISTINVDLKKNVNAIKVYRYISKFYQKSKFVKIKKINSLLSTNEVINTNNCLISICYSTNNNKLIILSAIDNLIKGGGGQAVQSMNLYFGFKENEGLNV
ncbi:MAG: N-acetyl-gamma-glutamyl-phosphate reductase [Candidatus Pelagibacter sp.]